MSDMSVPSPSDTGAVVQRQQSYAHKQVGGLQDRGTTSERSVAIEQLHQSLVQSHGFSARKAERDALANNTKFLNIPASQRGTVVNISA